MEDSGGHRGRGLRGISPARVLASRGGWPSDRALRPEASGARFTEAWPLPAGGGDGRIHLTEWRAPLGAQECRPTRSRAIRCVTPALRRFAPSGMSLATRLGTVVEIFSGRKLSSMQQPATVRTAKRSFSCLSRAYVRPEPASSSRRNADPESPALHPERGPRFGFPRREPA